jgi:hypothetical protein
MCYFYNGTEWMVKKWLRDEIYFQNIGSSENIYFQLNNVSFAVCWFVCSRIIFLVTYWKHIFMKIIKFSFNQTLHEHAHLSMQFVVILCYRLWIFDHLCYLRITIGNIIDYVFCHKGKLFVWYVDAVFVTTVRATGYHRVNVWSWGAWWVWTAHSPTQNQWPFDTHFIVVCIDSKPECFCDIAWNLWSTLC